MRMVSYITLENILANDSLQECQEKVEFLIIKEAVSSRCYFIINCAWANYPGNPSRSTPLNASAFGVTLDSSVKSRPGQQTISTSPGRLQFSVIICYNKIKR